MPMETALSEDKSQRKIELLQFLVVNDKYNILSSGKNGREYKIKNGKYVKNVKGCLNFKFTDKSIVEAKKRLNKRT